MINKICNWVQSLYKEYMRQYNDVKFCDSKFALGDYVFYDASDCHLFENEKDYKKRYKTFSPSIDEDENENFFNVMKKLPYPKNVYDVRYCIENFDFVIYLSFSKEKIKHDERVTKEDAEKEKEKKQRMNSLLKLNENV